MGQSHRPGRSDQHRQPVCDFVERARLVLWLDQSGEPGSKAGKPYGPDFPLSPSPISCERRKRSSARPGSSIWSSLRGPSFGGFEAYQWAVGYPDFVSGVAPVFTAPYSPFPPHGDVQLTAALAKDPHWNGGRYYDNGGVAATLTKVRVAIFESHGAEALLKDKIPNPAMRQAAIVSGARLGSEFRRQCARRVVRAHETFDVRPQFDRIKSKNSLYPLAH